MKRIVRTVRSNAKRDGITIHYVPFSEIINNPQGIGIMFCGTQLINRERDHFSSQSELVTCRKCRKLAKLGPVT